MATRRSRRSRRSKGAPEPDEHVEAPGGGCPRPVFTNSVDRARRDHESEVRDLHAKIRELTVEGDFLARGDKPDGLPTSPQAQQPRQGVINTILAA